jgi:hypothetical protein
MKPHASWEADGSIHLAISIVYSIDKKLNVVDGIPVKYDIGTVMADKCPWQYLNVATAGRQAPASAQLWRR